MPKYHYFDLFMSGEAPRQAFTIAGVDYEDIRLTGDAWKTFKESDKCEFGTLPILELDDGTLLSQSVPILRYICNVFGGNKICQGGDALAEWNADSLVAYWIDDFLGKVIDPPLR